MTRQRWLFFLVALLFLAVIFLAALPRSGVSTNLPVTEVEMIGAFDSKD